MTTSKGKKALGLEDFLSELADEAGDELDTEKRVTMKPADQRLDEIAREILRLQRDMTIPGSSSPDGVRLERLMRFIEEREF